MRLNDWLGLGVLLVATLFSHYAVGVDAPTADNKAFIESLAKETIPGLQRKAIGVTRQGTPLYAFVHPEDLNYDTKKVRITLVGGIDGTASSVRKTLDALRWFQTNEAAKTSRNRYLFSAVACLNPDGIANSKGTKNLSGEDPSGGYPPRGPFYGSATDPEAAYVWRWLGMHAPDVVVEICKDRRWALNDTSRQDSLLALGRFPASGTGKINAVALSSSGMEADELTTEVFSGLITSRLAVPSEARLELQKRSQRSPLEVARQLTKFYGHDLGKVEYIPALALVGRLRVGELANDPSHRADVERIVAPYVSGEKHSTPTSGSGQSGHLIFSELAKISEGEARKRYIELAKLAADQMFEKDGQMKAVMPFHSEMSDALFMGGPILASTAKLTGDARYADGCVQHLRFMRKLVQRTDLLYRHSPLDEAAWGRGNGFPALGLALVLSDFPVDHPGRAELLAMLQGHLVALKKYQDSNGSWHQVIDHEESYREFTCTCMIGFAMVRGIRSGWFEKADFEANVQQAWRAINARIDDQGGLVDVCTGTGKQPNLRAYYDREATLGRDARGAAMALMFSTELAAWEKDKASASR